jgi:hypothetical protein
MMNMLVSAAAIAGAPASAKAQSAGSDPVFAAIDVYRITLASMEEKTQRFNAMEEEFRELVAKAARKRMKSRLAFEKANPDHKFTASRDELLTGFKREEEEKLRSTEWGSMFTEVENDYLNVDYDAARELVQTVPTTAAGAAALCAVIREAYESKSTLFDCIDDEAEYGGTLLHTALASIEAHLARQVPAGYVG